MPADLTDGELARLDALVAEAQAPHPEPEGPAVEEDLAVEVQVDERAARGLLAFVDRPLLSLDEERLVVEPEASFVALIAARERALG
jgi:hypothetical protein